MKFDHEHPSECPAPAIADPQDLLTFLLTSEPRLRRKDAEREVLKRFSWWNPWKPGWRPAGFSSAEKDSEREGDEAQRASYQTRREEVLRQRRHRKRQQQEETARASQSRSGSDKKAEAAKNVFEQGDKALDDWTSKAAASSYDDLLVQDDHSAEDVVQTLFAALTRMRAERDAAISVIETLATERSHFRNHMAAQTHHTDLTGSLYRTVGLDDGCPDFILRAARTAYRKQSHPDVQPQHERAKAENRFKEAEAVFDQLFKLRGI